MIAKWVLIGALLASGAAQADSLTAVGDTPSLSCENPDIIKKYACLIRQEAEGAVVRRVAPVEFYAALQALNVVQNTVTSGRYSYLKRTMGDKFKSIPQADLCLDAGYGICGNHAIVFAALMEQLGIPVRIVKAFYISKGVRSSHAMAEVKIGEKWVLFDVTWGSVYFSDPNDRSSYLSLSDIDRIGYANVFPVRNGLSTWFFSRRDTSYDVFGHMTAEHRDITVDRVGEVIANLDWSEGNATSPGPQFFHFIGDNRRDKTMAGVSYYWDQPAGEYRIDVSSKYGGCKEPARICVHDQCGPLGADGASFNFTSSGERASLTVEASEDVCFAVVKDISITKVSADAL
ncbi:transglutaminase domain-containing protein [Hoeflea sp. YIM 152468]|uniref:transglutaminase domain-containing protein n=1 Tax=Hoeflea sp. YIM 152468 TaxID=3031759 RepID=UPI0023DCBD73|nr:transglutaminase domain-containing protein [Hoeflea sp. YIM 152468]MDF1609405.1 transglutaminase domain-containing protein [Hoeflea sp. YIM 152468]